MSKLIDDLVSYFEAHSDELLNEYDGKVLVISKDKEITPFDNYEAGYSFGVDNYGYGNFLLKECSQVAMNMVHVINPIVTVV